MTSYLYPYIQESINLNSKKTDNYIMTIQHSLDGLSFVIFDNAENKFIALKHYHISEKNISLETLLIELQEKESWKLEDFKNVNILIDNNNNTFVPKEYFQEEMKENYLSLLNIEHSNVLTDDINGSDIINVYSTQDKFTLSKENVKTYHSSSILVKKLIKEFFLASISFETFKTDKNGKATIEFYNNSSCTQMFISAEGITKDGKFIISEN